MYVYHILNYKKGAYKVSSKNKSQKFSQQKNILTIFRVYFFYVI